MKVTKISRQVKKNHRVSVFVDDEFSFGLSESQLIETGIAVGDELSKEQVEEYKGLSQLGKFKEMASAWALRRNHSLREIEQYIAKKTKDESEKNELIKYLDKLGFIDDERFAREWTKFRRGSGMSTFMIRGELFNKGISKEVIEKVVDPSLEIEALERLVEKKKSRSAYQDKNKFMKYLASKGYRYDDIKSVLSNQQD